VAVRFASAYFLDPPPNNDYNRGRKESPDERGSHVPIFLGLTFGLTFLLDLVLYLTLGYSEQVGTAMLLQAQMLIPAAVAIALQLFAFRQSRIYHLQTQPRWFFYFYLAFAAIYVLLAVSVLLIPNQMWATVASLLSLLLSVGGLVFVVILRLVAGREAFQRARQGVALSPVRSGPGSLVRPDDRPERPVWAGPGGGHPDDASASGRRPGHGAGSVAAGSPGTHQRGDLQGELIKMGKARGILLVGIVWGLWHAPIIMMGHNYPGYPVLGVLVMTLYTIGLGFFLGYAVLKSGSVWLAAFLHALNNGVASFLMVVVYRPDDPVFSFGIGLYGLIVWAIVVAGLLILDRKEWATPARALGSEGSPA